MTAERADVVVALDVMVIRHRVYAVLDGHSLMFERLLRYAAGVEVDGNRAPPSGKRPGIRLEVRDFPAGSEFERDLFLGFGRAQTNRGRGPDEANPGPAAPAEMASGETDG